MTKIQDVTVGLNLKEFDFSHRTIITIDTSDALNGYGVKRTIQVEYQTRTNYCVHCKVTAKNIRGYFCPVNGEHNIITGWKTFETDSFRD